jgi:hypothetical protein
MSANPGGTVTSYGLQAVCYVAFMAVVGYFATSPSYIHLPAGEALVKLSLQHAGQRKEACHERSAEELAKLAPNMRAGTVCPRERSPVSVEIEMDGKPLFAVVAPPTGLSHDGASTVFRRAAIPAGAHSFTARMNDSLAGGHDIIGHHSVDLKPGHILVIDYDAKDGWVFHG